MLVCKKFKFDAAHYLPGYDGVCRRLHGHTWYLEVEVEGPVDARSGFVIDFAELKRIVTETILDRLDHQCLNDVLKDELVNEYGVINPTCENLLNWVWKKFDTRPFRSPGVVRLRLYESPDSFAELRA